MQSWRRAAHKTSKRHLALRAWRREHFNFAFNHYADPLSTQLPCPHNSVVPHTQESRPHARRREPNQRYIRRDATHSLISHALSHSHSRPTDHRPTLRDPQDSAAFTSSPHRTTTIPYATRFDPTTSTPFRKLRHNSAVHTTQLRCSHSAASHTHSAVPHNSAVHTRACTVAFRLDSLGTGRANGDAHRDGRVWSHFGVAFPKHVLEGEALGDVGQALS